MRNSSSGKIASRFRGSSWIWVLGIIGVLAFGGFLAARDQQETSSQTQNATEPKTDRPTLEPDSEHRGPIHVAVVRPGVGGLSQSDTEPGIVEAYDWADLYSKVSGYLQVQNVDIGDEVKVGQVLAIIDAPELVEAVDEAAAELVKGRAQVALTEAAVLRAKADVDAAKANVEEKAADLDRAKTYLTYRQIQFERISKLSKERAIEDKLVDETQKERDAAQASVSVGEAAIRTAQADVEAKKAKVAQAEADVKNAQAKVKVATAALNKAKVFVAYLKIVSPYDGIITHRSFHIGAFIRAADQGGQTPLLTVARMDLMRVVVRIPERFVPITDPGDSALVELDALAGHKFTGKVSRIANSVDRVDKTMRVEVDLPNNSNRLRDGMFGRVTIQLSKATNDLTVPSASLVGDPEGKGFFVFVVRDGRAHKIPVRVARDNGIQADLSSGLQPDDLVIRHATDEVSEGTTVEPELTDSRGQIKPRPAK